MLDDAVPATASLLAPALQGLLLTFGLIVAIGAQNAFVLRQGLRREHVGSIVLFCTMADAVLMAAGVAGLAGLVSEHPAVARVLAGAGAVFLGAYGLIALWRARAPGALHASDTRALSRPQALAQVAAFTLLNPHVYLDTVLLVGSLGAQQPGPASQAAFVAGASFGSLAWFSTLGFGAARLAPLFARPRAWQVMDGLVGLTMLVLAWKVAPMAWPAA
ncbi:LysE/ArgO family amino acid transporter [Ideonella sp. YS5]|uniref:LysE/ArgO family amino acid transporter n=1 Tax=Ideonella sp. YS5 TaxID=3453714 RepID=UPI003EED1B8E